MHQILRSLSAASPFFEYNFALPRPPADPGNEERRAVIPMLEPGSTLQQFLHFVYSVPHPILSSLDELATILGVAVKYDFFWSHLLTSHAVYIPRISGRRSNASVCNRKPI